MGKITDFLFGFLATFDDNELQHVSTMRDPGKYRFAVDQDKVESNLGGVSFNVRRSDGELEEFGLVMGRLTADKTGGAIYIAARPPGSQDVKEVAYFDAHNVVLFGGRLHFANQGDGNLVLYVDGKPSRATFGLPPDRLW